MEIKLPIQKRVKTPTVLQMEATECGAASLAILLGYYEKYVTAEELRIACGVSRDGTKAINIVKAARNYGLEAYGANLEIEELQEKKVPFIVYWSFNHFLVVEGFSKRKVYLNDPATGPRAVSWDEFAREYTGVVLVLTPGPSFKKGGKPEFPIRQLFTERLKQNFSTLFFIVLVTAILIIPTIAIPIFTKAFIDYLLIDNQKSLIGFVLFGLAFTTLMTILLTWLQLKFLNYLTIKLDVVGSVSFFWHLLHIPINFFQQRSNGEVVERSVINEKIATIIAKDLPNFIVNFLKIIAFGLVIFILSWQIWVLLMILVLCNIITLILGRRKLTDLGRKYAGDHGKLEGIEANGIQIIETLKTSALEQYFFNRWASFYTKFLTSEQQLLVWRTLILAIPDFFNLMLNLAIIFVGAYLVMQGQLTIGSIVAIQALALNFLTPLDDIIEFFSNLFQIKGDMVRLKDALDTKIDPLFKASQFTTQEFKERNTDIILKANQLTFSYSPLDPPVIDDLSLTINRGEQVAIVGPSGSGKSSLAKLICGLNQPTSGEIFLKEVSYSQLNRALLSEFIAYVDQNIFLFSGSVRDNLAYWDKKYSDAELLDVLAQVHLDNDILLRGGLGLKLLEGGANLSGGQRQRLELARALLLKAQLLVLDEATSAMDPLLEAEVYANLRASNYSLLIIAHRLSAIRDCDCIYVVNEGQIVQQGRHEQLINEPGLYKELVEKEKHEL
ncbi:ABC-type bacteriocin/lantibiotic exporters, contain an N-terminal double-glycine peptidase domain [Legionella beliardensis]|uniref:ABC-type bacteriocin/lantibiotic exporters, contain an N-terminal double-glycine peptidase domain n=1 Tax=Legionella beliardensis TaxID=91822 RepID=A0A378I1N4_9GAMM|nr:cysteine peptidase family C39 domain-containing protein [Legionella beliardensis]STX28595.1 ABC-type bacteriocin/lantibiotic exporters, contain an N-terminal double-glycine peptidase domain [Legionella beliardensis]